MRTILCVSLFFALAVAAMAQTFGGITGQVADPAGGTVPGATILITNIGTNASRTAMSNEAGVYDFPSLPPGAYNMKVEKSGFKTAITKQIEVQVQQIVRLDITLVLGQVSESVDTIGTPHLGSPLASQLLQDTNACIRNLLASKEHIALRTATVAGFTGPGELDSATSVPGIQALVNQFLNSPLQAPDFHPLH